MGHLDPRRMDEIGYENASRVDTKALKGYEELRTGFTR
jgi:hypothetical protein